ncbi:MAG TPA: class I SAM-dependent methyltransferase [Verrucomicrobiae bacterium]|nr:class I SAM-dependent methyltransferase [Verrucomicrobiae bacterium]
MSGKLDSLVTCKTSQGQSILVPVRRLTRHLVVFEINDPNCVIRFSEALDSFEIKLNDQTVYSGRAVVSSVINTGTGIVCEAALKDGWINSPPASSGGNRSWSAQFDEFLKQWQKNYRIAPEFKLVIADLQTMLLEMRVWLEQAEFGLQSQPAGERAEAERGIINELQQPVLPALGTLCQKFEESCRDIPPEMEPVHRAYIQRQIHPLVLSAPFMNRTFTKPLGYAGDYEMVNMMVRDPQEGPTLFAKLLNTFFLSTPPVVAHRNRIEYLKGILTREIARAARHGTAAKIFNLGCGPAKEIQDFIAMSALSDLANFTLLDFNEETLRYTGGKLRELIAQNHRRTGLQMVERSIVQLLKESNRPNSSLFATRYDLVYCAGLFDYINDPVCQKLMDLFYNLLAPGGLLVATNVDSANPSVNWMGYVMDWHLIYRNGDQMGRIMPRQASPEECVIHCEPTGVNTFIEVRKPHG